MTTAARQYTTELGRELRFNATWTPGMRLALGTIGVIDNDHVFVPVSSIDQFGIGFKEAQLGNDSEETFNYASAGAVEIGLKLAGKPSALTPNLPIGRAGLGIRFNRSDAIVFRADGATHWRMADELSLAEEVISLIKAGRWDKDWSIITHLVRAASTTVLVARSSGAGVEFALSAGVTAGGLELLSADAAASAFASHDMQLTIVAAGGMTPLFRAKRVKRRWWLFGKHELRAAYADGLVDLEQTPGELDDDLFEDTPIYNGIADQPSDDGSDGKEE
jgi:hypothetical protein